ncbi:hypothetical protein ABZP36_007255, partial [Zizania latifolia]
MTWAASEEVDSIHFSFYNEDEIKRISVKQITKSDHLDAKNCPMPECDGNRPNVCKALIMSVTATLNANKLNNSPLSDPEIKKSKHLKRANLGVTNLGSSASFSNGVHNLSSRQCSISEMVGYK